MQGAWSECHTLSPFFHPLYTVELAEWEHKLKESSVTGASVTGATGAAGGGVEPTREDSSGSESEVEEEEEPVGLATAGSIYWKWNFLKLY